MDHADMQRVEAAKRTLHATDFPAGDLPQILDRLRDADGIKYDCAILGWESCQVLLAEIDRLKHRKCAHQKAREYGESASPEYTEEG